MRLRGRGRGGSCTEGEEEGRGGKEGGEGREGKGKGGGERPVPYFWTIVLVTIEFTYSLLMHTL